jgi:hypothetical protein
LRRNDLALVAPLSFQVGNRRRCQNCARAFPVTERATRGSPLAPLVLRSSPCGTTSRRRSRLNSVLRLHRRGAGANGAREPGPRRWRAAQGETTSWRLPAAANSWRNPAGGCSVNGRRKSCSPCPTRPMVRT